MTVHIDYSALPYYMREGMQLYIEHGIQPGSFLTAVMSNDLMRALGNADDANINALPVYGRFLYNHAPAGCYGSPAMVAAWVNRDGLAGIDAAS